MGLLSPLALTQRAHACGGSFGTNVEVLPDQTLAFSHREGQQTYLLRPVFCGRAEDFGLIVPIPSSLLGDPELASEELYDALETFTAPEVSEVELCVDNSGGTSRSGGGDTLDGGDGDGLVEISSSGSVDMLDWVELRASDVAALTAWLDERDFPYDENAEAAFAAYIEDDWSFVAFTVAASALDDGPEVCGSFGPIELGFETAVPVLPARIAVSHSEAAFRDFHWRIFAIAAEKLRVDDPRDKLEVELRFAGKVEAATMSELGPLGDYVRENEWVTEIDVRFAGGEIDHDLSFSTDDEQEPFRDTVRRTERVACDGCSTAPGPSTGVALGVALLALLWSRRHRQRAARAGGKL